MTLSEYCKDAIEQLSHIKGVENIRLYNVLRYDKMNRLFSHKIFGVEQRDGDFFVKTLGYITNPSTIPKIDKDTLEYKIYYINWLKEHATKI